MILGSPGALCLAMACSQRSRRLWNERWHPSKGHSREAMAGADEERCDATVKSVGGGLSAAGDAGPSAGGTPALICREEARRNGGRKDAAEWARRRWGDEEDAGVVVPLHDEVGLVKVVRLHFRLRGLRGVRDREDPEERW